MTTEEQVTKIQAGLLKLLVGEDKFLTVVAALSIATTSAHMINMPMLELQSMLVRMFQKRREGQ